MNTNQHEQSVPDERWFDQWDAAPRDGPAVFIVDTATYDRHGTPWGRWIDPTREPEAVRSDIEECVGIELTEAGQWAVVDQIGLGDAMIPEQLSIDALVHLCRARHGADR